MSWSGSEWVENGVSVYVRGSGRLRSEVDGKSFGVHTVGKPFTNGDCNGASQARQHHVSAPLARNSGSVIREKLRYAQNRDSPG